MFFSERSEALIVQAAVRQFEQPQKLPDTAVVPVDNREDAGELRPARTALFYRAKLLGVGVCDSIAHDDCFDTLFID